MAIYRLLQNNYSLQAKAMKIAYEGVLIDLQITDRGDPLTQLIAKEILAHAERGERDPFTLRKRVVMYFKGQYVGV